MRNRGGWERAAVVFSQYVWSSDTKTQAFFLPLTRHTVQQGAARPGQVGPAAVAWSLCARKWLCLYGLRGGVWCLTIFLEGYFIDSSHARVTEDSNREQKI